MSHLYTGLRTEAFLKIDEWQKILRDVTRESRFAHVLSYCRTQCRLGRVSGSLKLDVLRQTLPADVDDPRDISIAVKHLAFQCHRSDHENDAEQLLPRSLEHDVTADHAVSMYAFATGWLPSEHSPFDVGIV